MMCLNKATFSMTADGFHLAKMLTFQGIPF